MKMENAEARPHVCHSRPVHLGRLARTGIFPFRKDCGRAVKTTTIALASEEGIALVMVLILSTISLAIMAALVFMLTASTQMSGMQKRYKNALEAGKGGADLTFQLIATRGTLDLSTFSSLNLTVPASDVGSTHTNCMTAKLNTATSAWPAECNNTVDIDPADLTTYDMFFDLGTTPTFRVYGKIVDTVEGNSGADIGLQKAGVVTSNSGEVTAMSMPYLYTIEVDTMNTANPSERARYSILYQY